MLLVVCCCFFLIYILFSKFVILLINFNALHSLYVKHITLHLRLKTHKYLYIAPDANKIPDWTLLLSPMLIYNVKQINT